MDSNGNVIPIVEGDQGEGFKDIIDELEQQALVSYHEALENEINESDRRFWREQEKLRQDSIRKDFYR